MASKFAREWNAALKRGGFFGATTREAERACEDVITNPKGREQLEPSARNAAKLIRLTKAEIAKGNADTAARFAFMAGIEWQQARIAWAYGHDVRYAEKAAAAQERGRETKRKNQAAQMAQRRTIMARLVPQMGVQGAARHCQKKKLGDWQAIKKWWNRSKEKMRDID